MNEEKLRHGQALAMQWVAFALQKIIVDVHSGGSVIDTLLSGAENISGGKGLNTLALGCNYVVNFVLPLAIELSIKSLILKENKTPKRKHDLLILFNQLSPETQGKLENKYCEQRGIAIANRHGCLKQLLTKHNNDFENWRYLDKAEILKKEEIELQTAICSILDIYNSHV